MSTSNVGTVWRHKRTQNLYEIVGLCRVEKTWEVAYLYVPFESTNEIPIVRPIDEFLDGRFERVISHECCNAQLYQRGISRACTCTICNSGPCKFRE